VPQKSGHWHPFKVNSKTTRCGVCLGFPDQPVHESPEKYRQRTHRPAPGRESVEFLARKVRCPVCHAREGYACFDPRTHRVVRTAHGPRKTNARAYALMQETGLVT
jgi:hypothetical protein